jgi:hypothetical protein
LLLQSVLSQGEHGAMEAVLSSVIERIDKTDGTVCHEEVIGDYATFVNRKAGKASTDPSCDYKMVDTDYLLPVLLMNYFVETDTGKSRASAFLQQKASFLPANKNMTYLELAQTTAAKVLKSAEPFASDPTVENLIHIRDGESVGNWRDSGNGLGGGKIPYDVNTALVPAGLRAVASLTRAGFFLDHKDWSETADKYAKVWEDQTLQFFAITKSESDAKSLLDLYKKQADFQLDSGSSRVNGDITFYGLAIDNATSKKPIPVMVSNVPVRNSWWGCKMRRNENHRQAWHVALRAKAPLDPLSTKNCCLCLLFQRILYPTVSHACGTFTDFVHKRLEYRRLLPPLLAH